MNIRAPLKIVIGKARRVAARVFFALKGLLIIARGEALRNGVACFSRLKALRIAIIDCPQGFQPCFVSTRSKRP